MQKGSERVLSEIVVLSNFSVMARFNKFKVAVHVSLKHFTETVMSCIQTMIRQSQSDHSIRRSSHQA